MEHITVHCATAFKARIVPQRQPTRYLGQRSCSQLHSLTGAWSATRDRDQGLLGFGNYWNQGSSGRIVEYQGFGRSPSLSRLFPNRGQPQSLPLPKKENFTLPSNRKNVENRFTSLEVRLRMNANLYHIYYTHMLEYIQIGQVEVVIPGDEQEGTFYLPRQVVSKGKRGDTKWRIVFFASPHERGAHSLNDTLEMGPNFCQRFLQRCCASGSTRWPL
jgi:hypothetical protein